MAAARVAATTGAKLYAEVFPARIERGAGLPAVERIAYLAELASVQLAGFSHLILVDAKAPVSFFAYPGKKSYLVPDGCQVHELVSATENVGGTLTALLEVLNAPASLAVPLQAVSRPDLPGGKLTADKICQAIGALLPEGAIISDEAQTSGVRLASFTAGAPRHDVLTLNGGAIGQGLPVAVGAAVACPGRKVLALVGDGSAMYTIQSLWTMAREQLDVVVVVFNNRSYAILNIELERVGTDQTGPVAKSQLDLSGPDIDFVALGYGMGVPSVRVETCEAFNEALQRAVAEPGPHLIEAVVPNTYSGWRLKALPYGGCPEFCVNGF